MAEKKNTIEEVFQKSFGEHKISPSPKVLKTIKHKLFWKDYFSLNPRKFNILYSVLAIVAFSYMFYSINHNNSKATHQVISDTDKSSLENQSSSKDLTINNKQLATKKENKYNTPDSHEEFIRVKAHYTSNVQVGCEPLTVHFNNVSQGASSFEWNFGDGSISKDRNPVHVFTKPGNYSVTLKASNKNGILAEHVENIVVYEKPTTHFIIDVHTSDINKKLVYFKNKSKNATAFSWNFGDNTTSDTKNPNHKYSDFKTYKVSLIATSAKGCSDTVIKTNNFIIHNYGLVFPTQFKPGIQGPNSGIYTRQEIEPFVFYPKNYGAKEYTFRILSPNGYEVFSSNDISIGWDGYIRGRMAPAGVYSYQASGEYPNGQKFDITGEVKLVIDNSYQDYYNY
jgi:PKD repeat protein